MAYTGGHAQQPLITVGDITIAEYFVKWSTQGHSKNTLIDWLSQALKMMTDSNMPHKSSSAGCMSPCIHMHTVKYGAVCSVNGALHCRQSRRRIHRYRTSVSVIGRVTSLISDIGSSKHQRIRVTLLLTKHNDTNKDHSELFYSLQVWSNEVAWWHNSHSTGLAIER